MQLTKEQLETIAARKSHAPKALTADASFAEQAAFINDPARFIDAQCSRRAGKSTGLAIRFHNTAQKYPKAQGVYLALTIESAREILTPIMEELNTEYKLGIKWLDSKSTYTWPNGFKLRLLGADMKNFIKRLKGRKYPCVGVDEAQDFGQHLQSLIDDVLTPATSDYEDGWIAVTGTPGPIPKGYFFDVTKGRKYGYSHHAWTLFENPHMPNPRAFVEDIKKKREWDESNPTLRREYKNEWVLDTHSLWVRYEAGLNHFDSLPNIAPRRYEYILGVDVGYKDADALALLAWEPHSKIIYLVHEQTTRKQGITELADQIKALRTQYPISKIVMDEGALGKKAAEEMRRRHMLPITAAEKQRKQENVEFLNDALRLGRFKAKSDGLFAQDSYLVQIDWEKSTSTRIALKKTHHSDIIDAVLYAFKESPAYSSQAMKHEPSYGTKEWADKQEDAMWEAELERLTKEQNNDDPFGID